mgnify:CR=1 FL=1
MGIGARIMARRKALGMKRPELAERLGVKPNTLYRYEIGSIGIRDSMKSRIAKELGVSLAYLMSGAAEERRERGSEETPEPVVPPQIYLPILDQEACAGSGFNWSDVRAGARKWMPWPTLETGGPVGPTKPYFVKVSGDSMVGVGIVDGCMVAINPNIEVRNGDNVYVRWRDRCSIKGFIEYSDRIELRPANRNYQSTWIAREDLEGLKILGKVVRVFNLSVPGSVL